ncbi:MAG: hypothetical protein ABSE73_22875 [Planctomycetota bacterium]
MPLAGEPIKLHPDNPHYFLFRGKPTVLITSGEHYGAVLNLDFDCIPYLNELQARGFNLTRTFSGAYREIPGSFKITGNTLAPAPNRYLCPWARSSTPGYHDGGNKFDLGKFDEEYFRRLKAFITGAAQRGVVVEYVLFCPNYEEALWQASPLNARNNVNGVGNIGLKEPYTLQHPDLLAVQDAFVRKVAGELNGFDNLYYEICNEPYFGGVMPDWQAHIAEVLVETEAKLPNQHLLAQNIANGSAKIEHPDPRVSIFNFHYARPPDAVALNHHLNKASAFDETGFRGPQDRPYRTEAWDFILAGGAVYDNLDYSFTPHKEDGTAVPNAPGGGGPALRGQLKVLKDFMQALDFIKLAPQQAVVRGGLPKGATARVLAAAGRCYAVFVHDPEPPKGDQHAASFDLALELPAAPGYAAEWVNTLTGEVAKREEFKHEGGVKILVSPPYAGEIALRVLAR